MLYSRTIDGRGTIPVREDGPVPELTIRPTAKFIKAGAGHSNNSAWLPVRTRINAVSVTL
jgi:hypothetical protein